MTTQQQNPLRHPAFRRLWIGNTISACGDQFFLVALPWLILQLSSSGAVLGGILMLEAVPRALLMLVGGAVTDRHSPRRVLLAASVARALLVAALAGLVIAHRGASWPLYALVILFGVADAFAVPAGQALLPSVVPAGELAAANSLSQLTAQLATFIVPAPAGLLVARGGLTWAFGIDAVSFLFVIGALWTLRGAPSSAGAAPPQSLARSIAEGLQYVRRDEALCVLLLVAAALNFCITGPLTVGVAYVSKNLFGTPTALGVLMSSVAAGTLTGLIAASLRRQRRRGPLLLCTGGFIGLCSASMGLLQQVWTLGLLLFVMSASAGFLNVHMLTWFQQRVAPEFQGRVISVLMFAAVGLVPVSLAAAGAAVAWSLPGMFAGAGAALILVAAAAATARAVREID